MELIDIEENAKVYPGEYLLHIPTRQIVVCGAFLKSENKIKVLKNGQLLIDNIKNFQKIKLSRKEKRENKSYSCGGCKKR
jgi:hypothetical protein